MPDEFLARAARDLARSRGRLAHALLVAQTAAQPASESRGVSAARMRVMDIRRHIDYYTDVLGRSPYQEPEVPGIRYAATVGDACELILRTCIVLTTREMTTMLVESQRVQTRCAYNTVARALSRDDRFHKIGRGRWTLGVFDA